MNAISSVRRVVRSLGIGRGLLRTRHFIQLGLRRNINLRIAKQRYLAEILRARPMPCNPDGLEVHMLLQNKRVLEGIWTFYSFARFVPGGCKLVIHDDGTLQDHDVAALNKVFPSCSVIKRSEADSVANSHFDKYGLVKCRQMRDSLIFALKLFDVALYAKTAHVLLLDSDVLTIAECKEITSELHQPEPQRTALYMQDVCNQYCLGTSEMHRQLGRKHIVAFNPGMALVPAGKVDFARLESYLQHPDFWNADGSAKYFAELTLWAMELTLRNARPLPKSYAIAPTAPGFAGMTCCHYCGGVECSYLFYTDGIPRVREDLVKTGQLTLAT